MNYWITLNFLLDIKRTDSFNSSMDSIFSVNLLFIIYYLFIEIQFIVSIRLFHYILLLKLFNNSGHLDGTDTLVLS